jgi:succinylglutamate desuccinylase
MQNVPNKNPGATETNKKYIFKDLNRIKGFQSVNYITKVV